MKIAHTSDWHLGRQLYGKKRYDEFTAFFDWFIKFLQKESVDALIVAGDIFDNSTPSNKAQQLYYNFLRDVATLTTCKHIIIIAGNHDSPTFIDAPKLILGALNIHVVGQAPSENLEDILFEITNADGEVSALVAAVPYLRDGDVRSVVIDETIDERNTRLIEGISQYYTNIAMCAQKKLEQYNNDVALIATGHLFTTNGKIADGDSSVRDLYVGTLAHISADNFDDAFDYVALGHLHLPQIVSNKSHIRYSGSPFAMGFGEANQNKQIIIYNWPEKSIETHLVPTFRNLQKIKGDLNHIMAEITTLLLRDEVIWLEIEYNSFETVENIRAKIETLIENSKIEILRFSNSNAATATLAQMHSNEELAFLEPTEIFQRLLNSRESIDDKDELSGLFSQALKQFQEEDNHSN